MFANKSIMEWVETFLIECNFISVEIIDDERNIIPTEYGLDNGIVANAVMSKNKIEYTQIYYPREIQKMIIDKLNYDIYMTSLIISTVIKN